MNLDFEIVVFLPVCARK